MKYAIEFRDDESTIFYAGMYQGGLGFAPTLASALLYDSAEVAGRVAANGYGSLAEIAHIIVVKEEG